MTGPLGGRLVVPVVDAEDAAATARLLEPHDVEHVTAVHVVEKGGGVPDKLPVAMAEERAEAAFAAFREVVPSAATRTVYRRDVVGGIVEAAADVQADAIAFRPRGGSRLAQFLSGDVALRLVTEADRPVIALPHADVD